jgi:hypothetical protein
VSTPSTQAASHPQAAPNPDIVVRSSVPIDPESEQAKDWLARARAILGFDDATLPISQGIIDDREALGSPASQRVILARAERITVRATQPHVQQATLDLTCAFQIDPHPNLIAAWTDPLDAWTAPQSPEKIVRDVVNNRHQSVSCVEGPLLLESTIHEILCVLLEVGVPLVRAGQVVLRPRTVNSTWPPQTVDGRTVPYDRPRTYWIVVSHGYVAKEYPGELPIKTKRVDLIADDDPTVRMTSYLP